MARVEVFDPPMCCSTGVCGPQVDPTLARFSADLEWLKGQGHEVARFNLAQDPGAFVGNKLVAQAMRERDDALPLLLLDGSIVARGIYPDRETLARLTGTSAHEPIATPGDHSRLAFYSEAVEELVAIGAAIASNCEPCFRFHYDKARKLGVSREDMARAVATAETVKRAPARAVLELANKYLSSNEGNAAPKACCSPSDSAPVTLGGAPTAKTKCC